MSDNLCTASIPKEQLHVCHKFMAFTYDTEGLILRVRLFDNLAANLSYQRNNQACNQYYL